MRRGAERKMNEKGNGIEKKNRKNLMEKNGSERVPKGRCTSTDTDTTFITWPMKIAFFTLAFPVIQNITTVLDTERKTFLWPKFPD